MCPLSLIQFWERICLVLLLDAHLTGNGWALVTNFYLHTHMCTHTHTHTHTHLHPPLILIFCLTSSSPSPLPSLSPSLSPLLSLSFPALSLSLPFPHPSHSLSPPLFPSLLSFRPTLGCSVWQSTPTGCCPSTLKRWSRCTVERGGQKCHLTSSPSQTTPTETCCRVSGGGGRLGGVEGGQPEESLEKEKKKGSVGRWGGNGWCMQI